MAPKKKKNTPTLQEILEKPWCYYCERDFNDNKVLLDHQKAKHFSCHSCPRRLNTAGGLFVHLQQVHKETLTTIANAMEGRQSVEPEVFGMMGIPEDLLEAHKQAIINEYYKVENERRMITGNPPPGQQSGQPAPKKRKLETAEDIQARKAEFKAKKAAERQAQAEGKAMQSSNETPASAPAAAQVPAPSPIATHTPAYGASAQNTPNYATSTYPPAHTAYPGQAHAASSPYAAQAQGYSPYGMPPQQYPQPFSPQTHAPFSTPPGMPPNYQTMSPVALARPPVRHSAYKAPSPSNQSGDSSRQNSLPSASSGLPARPSFDPPNFNRQDMQRLHNGLAPPPSGNNNVPASSGEVSMAVKKITWSMTDEEIEAVLMGHQKEHIANKYGCNYDAVEAKLDTTNQRGDEAFYGTFAEFAMACKIEFKRRFPNARYDDNGVPIIANMPTLVVTAQSAAEAVAANVPESATKPDADAVAANVPESATKPAAEGKKKKSKSSSSKLVFSYNEQSPEELMATQDRYTFERNSGVEWSQGEVGGAVTGRTVDEDTVLDPQN